MEGVDNNAHFVLMRVLQPGKFNFPRASSKHVVRSGLRKQEILNLFSIYRYAGLALHDKLKVNLPCQRGDKKRTR